MLPEVRGASSAPRVNPQQHQTWVHGASLSSSHALSPQFVSSFSFWLGHGWQVIPPWWGIQFKGLTMWWPPTKDGRDLLHLVRERTGSLVSWRVLFEYSCFELKLIENSVLTGKENNSVKSGLVIFVCVCVCVYFWLVAPVVGLKLLSSVCVWNSGGLHLLCMECFPIFKGVNTLGYGTC